MRTVWLHHTVCRVYGEIQQLKDGIVNTLNFNHIIASNPQAVRSLFVPSNFHLTASFMQEEFIIEYSIDGSNDRVREEAVIMNWFDYLQDCEGK